MLLQEVEKKAEKEKRLVAGTSVLAAVFITSFKLIIGLLTNSLGILAEAAHSALDLVAAAVTFFAVRLSGRPPDEKQTFGYGKVENLSALFEALLLLVTCVWIIYEAIHRLFIRSAEVDVSIWSFVVMGTSIIVDVSRSRALMRMAKKHGSQALEADALHFSTDVWSSSVVIVGLALVTLARLLQNNGLVSEQVIAWLNRADAIAALGVSLIVIYVSVELGKRTIEGLLDRAPAGLQERIKAGVSQIPGIKQVRQVRIRPSGPYSFVDMILEVPRSVSLEQAHLASIEAKNVVQNLVERSDVIIHLDPMVQDRTSIIETIHSVAARHGLGVHSIRVHEALQAVELEMHIEVPENLDVASAHRRVSMFEAGLCKEVENVTEVVTHIEPCGDKESHHKVVVEDSEDLRHRIMEIVCECAGIEDCHNFTIYRENGDLCVSFHCNVCSDLSISEAHSLTARIERQLMLEIPELENVVIHVEPFEDADRITTE